MNFHGVQSRMIWFIIFAVAGTASTLRCERYCGRLNVPYPFGTSKDCAYDDSFVLSCKDTFGSKKLFLGNNSVLGISLDGEIRVSTDVTIACYNRSGLSMSRVPTVTTSNFPLSFKKNKFVATGCDTIAIFNGSVFSNEKTYLSGCISSCISLESISYGSCSGLGCCESTFPPGFGNINVVLQSSDNHSKVMLFNPCDRAFVIEEKAFKFSKSDLQSWQSYETVPTVLDWAVGNKTCLEAQNNFTNYACKAEHSACYNSNNGPGYLCKCLDGFQGNPYLFHGCQDKNECQSLNPCKQICHNNVGGFQCACPKGFEGDGMKNGTGCIVSQSTQSLTNIRFALPIIVGLLALLLVGGYLTFWVMRINRLSKIKRKFFERNGGLLLGSVQHEKLFTAEDLQKATNNYNSAQIIGQGGSGVVYKGLLPNNRLVAIKKSKFCEQTQVEDFINEISLLLQIRHPNIVQLIGFCLETEVPLLVYEYMIHGSLFEHLHVRNALLSLEERLKFAMETANGLAYLHFASGVSILHRDIKSSNILLDKDFTAKISDFGISRLKPNENSHLTTLIQGTAGYIDPEYFCSSHLTDKSDVYSFGVILAELLTRRKAVLSEINQGDRNLAKIFVSALKEGRLAEILDDQIVEASVEQLREVSNLTMKCLSVKGEDRPSMQQVESELGGLIMLGKINFNTEGAELLFSEPSGSANSFSD